MVGPEAMSFGKPVVAFDVGGISEWLTHQETGFLIKPFSTSLLAESINFLLHNPGAALRMGKKARDWVEKRSMRHRHLEKLEHLFRMESGSYPAAEKVKAQSA